MPVDLIPQPTFDDGGLDLVEYQQVSQAYFQGVVGQGNAARARAQAGFAIVSAIAGAVVAFSLSSTISGAADVTKDFTYASLVLWGGTAAIFLIATIMQPLSAPPTQAEVNARKAFPTGQDDEAPAGPRAAPQTVGVKVAIPDKPSEGLLSLRPVGFVAYAFRLANQDARNVSCVTLCAGYVAALAMLALLGAAGGLLFDSAPAPRVNAIVTVSSSFFHQYESRCEVLPANPSLRDLVGQVAVSSLTGSPTQYVDLEAANGTCQSSGHFIIPRSDVVSIEEYGCPLSDVADVSGKSDPLVPCPGKATPLRDIYHWIVRRK